MITPLNDPNVRIPRGAKKAAARADELHKQAYSKEEKPAEPTGETNGDQAPQEQPASAAAPEVTPEAPAPAEPAHQPAAPEPPREPQLTVEQWEHRYNSMKGRVERSDELLRAATSRIASLEDELAELRRRPTNEPRNQPTENLLTEKEVQDYGEEFLTVVGKKAREIAGAEVAQLKETIDSLSKQIKDLGGTVVKSAQDKMFAALDQGCAKWKEINTNPNFIAWLQLPDTYSGVIRHDLLKAAFERNDSPRVLAFFNGFLAEEAAVAPAPLAVEPTPAASAPGKVPLADLAAPGRAKSPAAQPAPAEKPTITRAQIAGFYTDVANGKYRGKDEERARLERMIFEAQQDGRIR